MASRILILGARALKTPKIPTGAVAMSGGAAPDYKHLIGNREVVGFGVNGQPIYIDRADFPFPAVRWQEPTTDLKTLREKEKGDWHKLSSAEKKALYRASFRQTFAEFQAPTGEWKQIVGLALVVVSAALWLFYGAKTFVYSPLPISFNKEYREAAFRRMIDLQVNPVQGLASKWDYEKDDWKK